MKIEINTTSYNHRRYGNPWIAVVDFTDPKGDFKWGQWIGEHGSDGLLQVEANVGDIVAQGQKDFRNQRHSAPNWYQVVEANGDSRYSQHLKKFDSKVEAYKAWRDQRTAVTQ